MDTTGYHSGAAVQPSTSPHNLFLRSILMLYCHVLSLLSGASHIKVLHIALHPSSDFHVHLFLIFLFYLFMVYLTTLSLT